MSGRAAPLARLLGPAERRAATAAGDLALLAACAGGETTALGLLFDRHERSVRGFLARACQVPYCDLDDLVHATFLEVYRSAASFRGSASARTWIIGIAINVARHYARSEARRRRFLVALAGAATPAGFATQESLEHRQALDRLAGALGELTYPRRAAFVLCEMEGLTAAEAAEALGTRAGTVGRWLHEARKDLRAAIAGAVEWTSR